MEPSAAVELFNNGPKHNVKYSTYTGDDDSTTAAHICEKVCYKVEKLSDIVHMKRSLTTRLYNSSTLSQKVINYLVKYFSYAITQNKGNSIEIKKNQLNALYLMHLETTQNAKLVGADTNVT